MLYDYLKECYETATDHTELNDAALNNVIKLFKEDHERRYNELLQFLDEFVNSEEYKHYLECKRKIRKHTVYTQYSLQDLKDNAVEDKYPFTTQTRKMFVFKQYFDKYIKNKENTEIVNRQKKGIEMIKEKMAKFKTLYENTKDKISQEKEKQQNNILEEFCESLNIDVSTLNLKSRNKIRDTVVCYQKIKNSRNVKVKNNIMEIVKKLTEEYKRKKEIDKTLNKTYLYKIKRKEKIVKDMEIVGEKIILKPRKKDVKEEVEIVQEKEQEEPPLVEEELVAKKTKKGKDKKDKKGSEKSKKGSEKGKDKSKKKDKKGKKNKEKKLKKDKKGKKDKKKDDELLIPPIPKCNLREKFGPENYEKMLELLTDFERLEDILEDQHLLAQKHAEEENTYDDQNFFYKPNALIFKNSYCGKIYRRNLKIINTGTQFQKLRLLGMVFTDPYDALFFKVEPLFGIQRLASGCSLQLTVTFTPAIEFKQIDGKIIFVAYNRQSTRYQKFFVKIQCIPSYFELKICPNDINFGKIPIWRAHGLNRKTIKLKNDGNKQCEAIIKKMPSPLTSFDEYEMKPAKIYQDKLIECISEVLEECLDNVFSYFEFDHYFIKIQGFEEIKLNVRFKNVDYVGNYFEIYYLDIYETCENDNAECTGCQQICISAETSSNFIEISPECVDFGVCIINNTYQLSCDVYNKSLLTQSVSLKFPSNLIDYIKTDVSNLYIPSLDKRTIWLKFLPRKHMLEGLMYYDKATSILEFPIYFCVSSKTFPDIPPLKAVVFAILTPQKCLSIVPTKGQICEIPSATTILNLGECSIFETVFADIELVNNTLASQIYAFTNIPQCLTIMPDYGFGKILPNETKTLRIYFSPDFTDVINSADGSHLETVKHFKINLETMSFLGQYKMPVNTKQLKKAAELMLKVIKNREDKGLIQDIQICAYYIKINLFSQDTNEEGFLRDSYDSKITPRKCDSKTDKPCTTQLWLKAKIKIPLVEFSHQCIEFPDTPCGSYSTMQIYLRAVNLDYYFKKAKPQTDYTASFEIHGGSGDIRIEPTRGSLKQGESKKITLIAKPNPPSSIIINLAKQFKYSEVYERKKQEIEMKKQGLLEQGRKKGKDKKKDKNGKKAEKQPKQDKKSKKEDKKTDKGSKKSKGKNKEQKEKQAESEEKEPEIIVTDKDLTLDYLDFYPAEMFHWRNLQPYTIKADFECTLNYESEDTKKPETLYLNAVCRVIRPDFITNLKLQRIDFGQVVIGMKKRESVLMQNISYDFIEPEFGLLNPLGPFTLPLMKKVKVPQEHFLEVPVTFEPKKEGKVEEYFEISSGATILPLILEGIGVAPNVDILPNFLVFRMDTKKNTIAQCPIEIRNKNECELPITIEKLFELKGCIKEPVKIQEAKTENKEEKGKTGKAGKAGKVDKKSKKSKETSKGAKNKKDEIPKFSDHLMEAEQASFKNFTKKSGEFFYDVINVEQNNINLEPKSTKVITIGFGLPEVVSVKKREEIRKLQEAKEKVKGKKDKGNKKAKASKGSKKSDTTKGSKKSNASMKKMPEDQVFYVAKYNIMLNKTFLKDIILISTIVG